MSRSYRLPPLVALVLLSLVATGCKKAPTYQTVERPPVSLDMPQWPVAMDEGSPGVGKYKVEREDKRAFVEVSWHGGSAVATPEELRLYAKSLVEGFKVTPEGEPTLQEGPSNRRLTVLGSIMGGDVWMNLSMVACLKTGVLLVVGAGATERHTAMELHDRSVKNLRCLGDSPADFALPGAPRSTLEDVGFTVQKDGDGVQYTHPDGAVVFAAPTGTSLVDALVEHPAKTLTTLSVGLEMQLRLVTPIVASVTGLGGTSIRAVEAREKGTKAPFALGAFKCAQSGLAYMVIATGPKGIGLAKLETYMRRLGCPASR